MRREIPVFSFVWTSSLSAYEGGFRCGKEPSRVARKEPKSRRCYLSCNNKREKERERRLSRRAYFQHIIIYNPDADPVGLELSSTVLVSLVNPVSVWFKKCLQHSSCYTKYLLIFVYMKLLNEKIIHT